MSRSRLRHRLEHLCVTTAAAAVVRLPEPVADRLGVALGWIAGTLLRIRLGVVMENLARAFPQESPSWHRRVARETYRHFGREVVSLIRFQRLEPAEIRARCSVEGLDLLEEPIARGQGVIALAGHFGNWEIAAVSATSRGVPVDAVARLQRNPLFDAYMTRVRERLGVGVIYQHEATRRVMKRLREGRVVALVADQNFAGEGVFVDFFGVTASTARGPGVLAMRTGAPVVFVDPRRLPGSRATYAVRFTAVDYEPTEDSEENVRRLTRAFMVSLERVIQESPGQYFWFHRRWKTRPGVQEPLSRPQVASDVEQVPRAARATEGSGD